MSDETIELLEGVDKQVDIYCISESRDTIVEFSEMLDKYDNASDLITVTYINPQHRCCVY